MFSLFCLNPFPTYNKSAATAGWKGLNVIQDIILTLSAPQAILRFLQTMQIQVSQLVTSCLTCNQHCLPFSYQNSPKLEGHWTMPFNINWEMDTPDLEHGRVYFKQFGAERVKWKLCCSSDIEFLIVYSGQGQFDISLSTLGLVRYQL